MGFSLVFVIRKHVLFVLCFAFSWFVQASFPRLLACPLLRLCGGVQGPTLDGCSHSKWGARRRSEMAFVYRHAFGACRRHSAPLPREIESSGDTGIDSVRKRHSKYRH